MVQAWRCHGRTYRQAMPRAVHEPPTRRDQEGRLDGRRRRSHRRAAENSGQSMGCHNENVARKVRQCSQEQVARGAEADGRAQQRASAEQKSSPSADVYRPKRAHALRRVSVAPACACTEHPVPVAPFQRFRQQQRQVVGKEKRQQAVQQPERGYDGHAAARALAWRARTQPLCWNHGCVF